MLESIVTRCKQWVSSQFPEILKVVVVVVVHVVLLLREHVIKWNWYAFYSYFDTLLLA